jgi:hypothetical protein
LHFDSRDISASHLGSRDFSACFPHQKRKKIEKKYLDTTRAEALRYLHICAMQSQNIDVDNGDPVDGIPIVEGVVVSGPCPTSALISSNPLDQ